MTKHLVQVEMDWNVFQVGKKKKNLRYFMTSLSTTLKIVKIARIDFQKQKRFFFLLNVLNRKT